MQATVTVAYVNKERPERHEKKGTIKTREGRYYKVWPADLGLFKVGGVYEIEYSTYQQNGEDRYGFEKLIRTVSVPEGAEAPPSNGETARRTGPGFMIPASALASDRSARIERQHSQSAAIEWLSLLANATGQTPTLEDLDKTTDWLQSNIGKTPVNHDELTAGKEPMTAQQVMEARSWGDQEQSKGFDL